MMKAWTEKMTCRVELFSSSRDPRAMKGLKRVDSNSFFDPFEGFILCHGSEKRLCGSGTGAMPT